MLRAGHYWVPHWYKASNTVAYWDKFARPATKPRYDRGILDTWWYDEARAAEAAANPNAPTAATSEEADDGASRLWLILGGLLVMAVAVTVFLRGRRRAKG